MSFCRYVIPAITGILCLSSAFGQKVDPDSIYKLPEVKVSESRLNNFSTGLSIIKIDKKQIEENHALNLAEIISENSAVFLKTYGQGSLATIAIRGTGPAHTGLFWNGININPPNLGLSDYALIPSALINTAEIQLGSSASLYGSGVIGGAVHLNSKPEFRKKTAVAVTGLIGSFGLYEGSGEGTFSNEKWYSRVATYYRQCENNFPYNNIAKFNSPEEKLASAEYYSYGATAEIHRAFKNNYFISLHSWHTYTHRNLPPSMTSIDNNEQQSDSSFRFLIEGKKHFAKSSLKTKVAFLNEFQRYTREIPADTIIEKYSTNAVISEAEYAAAIFKQAKLNIGINYSWYAADITEYQKIQTRNQGAAFLSFMYMFEKIKWKTTVNLRQELVESYTVPFTPSLGLEGKVWKFISAKANVSRSYRIPTMNDRFWQPGGNPNLKPESGWNAEAGFSLSPQDSTKNIFPSLSFTCFTSSIDNWIAWQPTNTIYWSPVNLQKVWARGIETNGSLIYNRKPFETGINVFYTYTLSTVTETSQSLQATVGKQLIYVPLHNLVSKFSFKWKRLSFSYSQVYTGKRFTSTDNVTSLPGYTIGNIILNYGITLKKYGIDVGFRCNNIWNTTYQTIAWRPMPGRSFNLSLTFKFSSNNN